MFNIFTLELVIFGILMVIFGFLTSYITDFMANKPIIWLPDHSSGMASGIFFTSVVVFFLFSEKYINYKCNKL
jgi:hypothetical protein